MMKINKKQFLFHSWKIRAEGRIPLSLDVFLVIGNTLRKRMIKNIGYEVDKNSISKDGWMRVLVKEALNKSKVYRMNQGNFISVAVVFSKTKNQSWRFHVDVQSHDVTEHLHGIFTMANYARNLFEFAGR